MFSNRKSYNLLTIAKFLVSQEQFELESDSDDSITDDGRADYQAAILKWFIKKMGNKRRSENLLFGLNCYLVAPLQYTYIPKIINIPFPTVTDLKKIKLKFGTGVSEDLITHLGRRLNYMPPGSKYINLYIDEVPLTSQIFYDITGDEVIGYQDIGGVKCDKVASKAFVVAMNSCVVKLHLPLGYIFTSATPELEDISKWIDKIVKQLSDAGYVVCAVISKQTTFFHNLAKLKGVTVVKPYFEIGRNRIFYIFDPEYVMIDIRDTLMMTDLHYGDDKVASWDDVVSYSARERDLLTPGPHAKTEWRFVGQLYSRSVGLLIERLYEDTHGTSNFVYKMSELVEIAKNRRNYKREYVANENQVKCFKDIQAMFESMKVPKRCHDPILKKKPKPDTKCIEGILITVNGIMQMWEYFSPMGLKSIVMAKISMAPTNKVVQEIKKITNNNQPTPIQFKRAFSQKLVTYLIKNSVKFDCDESLVKFMKGEKMPMLFKEQMPRRKCTSPLVVRTTTYRFDPVVEYSYDPHRFTCRYLLLRCRKEDTCIDLENYRVIRFMAYVRKLDDIFNRTIKDVFLRKGLGKHLLNKFLQAHDPKMQPCKCFPVNHLMKLYLRMNIFRTVRRCNQDMVNSETETNQNKRKRRPSIKDNEESPPSYLRPRLYKRIKYF